MMKNYLITFLLFVTNALFSQNVELDDFEAYMCVFYYDEELKKDVYPHPQIRPEFPNGGDAGVLKFVSDNLVAQEQNELQGRVRLYFIVDDDGSVQCAKVIKRINKDSGHYNERYEYKTEEELTAYDKEFLRILKIMPAWTPAICDGENVASFMSLPIHFNPTQPKKESVIGRYQYIVDTIDVNSENSSDIFCFSIKKHTPLRMEYIFH